jgi:hypothetical protein
VSDSAAPDSKSRQQTRARVHREIAERVEEKVAAEIGPIENAAALLALDAHETRVPPRCETSQPWRTPPRAFAAAVAMKKAAGAPYDGRLAKGPSPSVRGCQALARNPSRAVRAAPSVVAGRDAGRGAARVRNERRRARVNVLRTAAEALLHAHLEPAVGTQRRDRAIRAIAPARRELDPSSAIGAPTARLRAADPRLRTPRSPRACERRQAMKRPRTMTEAHGCRCASAT